MSNALEQANIHVQLHTHDHPHAYAYTQIRTLRDIYIYT